MKPGRVSIRQSSTFRRGAIALRGSDPDEPVRQPAPERFGGRAIRKARISAALPLPRRRLAHRAREIVRTSEPATRSWGARVTTAGAELSDREGGSPGEMPRTSCLGGGGGVVGGLSWGKGRWGLGGHQDQPLPSPFFWGWVGSAWGRHAAGWLAFGVAGVRCVSWRGKQAEDGLCYVEGAAASATAGLGWGRGISHARIAGPG